MIRKWRIVSGGLTGLSLLLCAALTALWVRSYRVTDSWMLFRRERTWEQMWLDRTVQTFAEGPVWEVDSHRGVLRALYLRNDSSYARSYWGWHWSESRAEEEQRGLDFAEWTDPTVLGFGVERTPVAEQQYNDPPGSTRVPAVAYTITAVYTPIWFWIAAFAAAQAPWMARRIRKRGRIGRGLCPGCGYDLRATRERCPECGMAPQNSK